MFIPHTPGSLLKSELNKIEEALNFNGRIRYCEELGSKISDLLVKDTPWESHCGRLNCMTCIDRPGQCYKQSVVYKMICGGCKEQGQTGEYYGESARSAFDRGAEHIKALRSNDNSNPLVAHWKEFHGESEWNYSMKVIKTFKSPLQRQSCEGFLIANFKGDVLLNRKGEWGQNLPPKIVIEDQRDTGQTPRILQFDPPGSKRPNNQVQVNIIGQNQNQNKRSRLEDQSDENQEATETEFKVRKKGKVPEVLRSEARDRTSDKGSTIKQPLSAKEILMKMQQMKSKEGQDDCTGRQVNVMSQTGSQSDLLEAQPHLFRTSNTIFLANTTQDMAKGRTFHVIKDYFRSQPKVQVKEKEAISEFDSTQIVINREHASNIQYSKIELNTNNTLKKNSLNCDTTGKDQRRIAKNTEDLKDLGEAKKPKL